MTNLGWWMVVLISTVRTISIMWWESRRIIALWYLSSVVWAVIVARLRHTSLRLS